MPWRFSQKAKRCIFFNCWFLLPLTHLLLLLSHLSAFLFVLHPNLFISFPHHRSYFILKVSDTSALRRFREYLVTESIRCKWKLPRSLAFFSFSFFAKDVPCFSKGNLFHNTAVISGRFMRIRLDIEKDAQSTKPIKLTFLWKQLAHMTDRMFCWFHN